ncbi:MAG: amino acid adenylation domain-containing protein [Clostridia bacterium]|nr:amino acid adenylation domain-containing protein [Clostridia bacterium]
MAEQTFSELFQAQVSLNGTKTAIIDPAAERRMTYAELDEYSGRVAAKMRENGVGHGDSVALVMPDSLDTAAAMLAAMKLGAACAVLNSRYPEDRLQYIFGDCRARLVVRPDFFGDLEACEPVAAEARLSGSDLALLVYTSGSTGKPKGVAIDHQGLCGSIHGIVSGDDVFGQGAPMYFIAGSKLLLTGLARGCTNVLVPPEAMRDPGLLSAFLAEYGVSVVFISPKVLRYFKAAGSALRRVITGSERLSGIWSDQFEIYNTYGISEAVGDVLHFRVDRPYDNTPIGKPIGNERVYLLDENGCEAEEGEICLTGFFAREYLNLPEESARVFVRNPFRDRDGFERMLRTGDLGRILPDGNILYLNRKDWMVKINGQRVEPGETEAALRRIAGIRDAAVKDFTDGNGEVFLVGYYTADAPMEEDRLREALTAWLPDYMIPARFVRLDSMPVNPNGKLDRSALLRPDTVRQAGGEELPENDAQQAVFDCVAEAAGHRGFGVNTDLTRIGLTSIGMIRLTSALSDRFHVPVSIAALRDRPTVKALERWLSAQPLPGGHEPQADYPLTQTQQGILAETLSHPDTTIYNVPLLFALSEAVDPLRLQAALGQAIAAHPYLSGTVFADGEGNYRMARNDSAAVRVELKKTRALPEDLLKPFDIAGGPLYRAQILMTESGNYLFLDFHHIAFDGASAVILLGDIDSAYAGETPRKETYSGFEIALDEEALRKTDAYPKARAYYENLLSGAERDMLPRGDADGDAPQSGWMTRDSRLRREEVEAWCRENGVTANAFFNAVFACVLSRYVGLDEALYTTVYNGRNDSRMDRAVTMLVKTLPVACRLDGNRKIADFVRETGSQLMDSMAADLFSFAEISDAFDVSPEVMFVYQGDQFAFDTVCGAPAKRCALPQGEARETLGVTMFAEDGRFLFECEYRADRYSGAFIRGFVAALDQAAEEFMRKECLKDVSILDSAARKQTEALNDTDVPLPEITAFRMFEKHAHEHPDRPAVIAAGETLTYGELNARANRIAAALIGKGLRPQEPVGILLPRTGNAVAAEYGIMKAGGAFLPMLPDYPEERIDYCMTDSGARFVLTTEETAERMRELPEGKPYTALSADRLAETGDDRDPDLDVPMDALAYCIYTSGSTGRPKGVMIEHGNLSNFLYANEKNRECFLYVTRGKTALSVAALSFDFSLMEIHLSLANGMTLCMAGEEEITNPLKLAELITARHVDVISGTPSFLSNLLDIPEAAGALGGIRLYDLGAEAFPVSLYEKLKKASPDALIVNGYGPTEATISCVSKVIEDPRRITIGRPAANVKAWIFDSWGHMLPPGARGELVLGGLGVGRGYIGLPEKNAEVFLRVDGMRAYRTGDLACVNGDGEIEFLGRMDSQVKLHGLRIELSEIENVLNDCPAVQNSVVKPVRNEAGEEFLCAWFTAAETADPASLKERLATRLPRYMIPAAFVQIERIPVTRNGKVDWKALPPPLLHREDTVPPQNGMQQRIFDCVSEVLGHRDFGITTNFDDAGLSSLGAIRLTVLLFRAFGKPISIQDLKNLPTVTQLEAFLKGQAEREEYGIRADYPVTQTQMGVLAESLAHPDTTIYNIPMLFRLSDKTDPLRLRQAAETAFAAHPYLNAVFYADEHGEYRVKRDDSLKSAVELIRTDRVPDDPVEPFRLTGGRLYRAVIYVTGAGNYFFLDLHHLIGDGASIDILLQDINAAYAGEPVRKEEYTGYELALDEEKRRGSEQYGRARAYFGELLSEADSEMLPPGDAYGEEASSETLTAVSGLSLAAVHAYLQENGLSPNAFFNAVFAFVLSRFTGRDEALYTTVYNGRSDARTSRTVTMMVKTFPVFCRIREDQGTKAFAEDMARQLMNSMTHEICSFAEIAAEHGIRADILFVYQGETGGRQVIGGGTAESLPLSLNEAKAPLHLELSEENGQALFTCEYRGNLFSEAFVRSFLRCLEKAAEGFMAGGNLGDISLLDEKEAAWMDRLNETGTDDPVTDVVSLFRAAAEKYPENTAVVFRDEACTYRQADEISGRIAGFLREQGVGRGDVVSILIPRGPWMAIASLGVLKAGAAYQPLDPGYPPERLSFMVRDADCRLLIAEEALLDRLPEYKGPVLLTRDIPGLPACDPIRDHPAPEDLFILLYTSGSTGVPKGVMLEHRNIAGFCGWYRDYYQLDAASRVAAYASYGFDACMMDLYPALTTGAGVYIVEEEIRMDLPALEDWFNRMKITHAFMTTQVARQFYSLAETKTLRHLSAGGEKLVPLPPREGGPKFYNGYGPTECTIFSTVMPVERLYNRVPIGRPLSNYRCYVADKNLRRLPPLVPGELLIAGRGVGRGYLNRPDLTEKAFIRNPFSSDPAYARAYRTGDVVRLLPDGNIDFLGRNDGQVKVRGFRIELTEVEGVIREFPGIRDATVQAFEDEHTGEKYLAAYVVSDEQTDTEALARFIAGRKPAYMVPAVILQIPVIPLNQNQKVNRKALPRPVYQAARADILPPRNDVQRKIHDCVAEVTGNGNFGITTNLEEAGLSSIGLIRLVVLLSKAFGVSLSSRDLKANPTVEKLETFLAGGAEKEQAREVYADYGLTRTQQGIYVECVARPDSTVYNVPILLKIADDLDPERLRRAIVTAVNAHPILKTRLFLNDDGDARMRRMDADFSFDENAIPVRRITDIEAEKLSLVQPFKLLGGRLFRAQLLRGDGLWLFMEVHHIIADGSSVGILLRDISRAYAGEEPEAETFTGFDVTLNEEKLRSGPAYDAAKNYYEKLLDGVETANLPAGDAPDAEGPGSLSFQMTGAAPAEVFESFCRNNGCSMNGLFSAAFGLTLDKYLGVDAAAFAGIYSGRNDSRFTDTVAMLVKTLPIVVTQRPDVSCAALVREVTRQLTDSQTHDIYSFAEIRHDLHAGADVLFAWQGDEFAFDTLCGKSAQLTDLSLSDVKAPINVNAMIAGGRIVYAAECRSDLYSEDYLRRFVEAVDTAACGLARLERLDQVSILPEKAEEELHRFNSTDADGPFETAPELFLRAVRQYGDRTAVLARGGKARLTYREWGERALKVAHALAGPEGKPAGRVALYMDRTEDVYAIRQGIMLAGGAFVSLEPDYPDDRILYILKDADISRLITDRAEGGKRAELFGSLPSLEVLFLEDIYAAPESHSPLPAADADSPAYCIYTSGSTGNPKGVEILHRNLANLLHYDEKNTLARAYVDHATTFLALAAFTFDVSVIEEMMPLFHGCPVSVATREEIHNPLLLMQTVARTGVDMMKCTPSYLQTILDVPQAREALAGLKALIVGAEPFPPALYRRIREAGFTGILFNSYGPTETCVSVSIGILDGRTVTVGGPTMNTVFLIRDRFGNTLPPYARGELIIAGAQVGRGYIGLPEQTREKFIPLNLPGRTLNAYRSGDIAYFDRNGSIVHCGRNDNQVKIRGLRIELDGVENVMNTFPGIRRSVVLVKGEGDGQFLCGYYVSDAPVDEEKLAAHMKQTLTAYMIPGVFVHLTHLPLTVNGKVNKKALPEPAVHGGAKEKKPASTPMQKQISEIFAKALGVLSVGTDEDFFDIGGTSMLASKVAMQAMVAGLPIVYQDLFTHPTVEALERLVREKENGGMPALSAAAGTADVLPESPPCRPEPAPVTEALKYNNMDHIGSISSVNPGPVLLTGATGFLGIHVLRELLDNSGEKITCLIRKGHLKTARQRLESMLFYYFESNYREAFESGRLTVIDGDITDEALASGLGSLGFQTLINCAANVKHFANDDILERVNVLGVRNLIGLCEKTGSMLVQISTVSVAGENVDHALPETAVLKEDTLFFGQDLSNQYVRSKFKAEEDVLQAISEGRLRGKILRVGNLMSRNSDGEFQINFTLSGFMRHLRGYAAIGAFPVTKLASPVEFSPIDKVAQAVRLLVGTPDQFTVFHPVNSHCIEMGDVIAAMNEAGLPVNIVSEEEFAYRLSQAMKNEQKNMLVAGLISYLSSDARTVRSYVPEEHTFTKNALYRLGFRWPLTDDRYLQNMIKGLMTLNFFDS